VYLTALIDVVSRCVMGFSHGYVFGHRKLSEGFGDGDSDGL